MQYKKVNNGASMRIVRGVREVHIGECLGCFELDKRLYFVSSGNFRCETCRDKGDKSFSGKQLVEHFKKRAGHAPLPKITRMGTGKKSHKKKF